MAEDTIKKEETALSKGSDSQYPAQTRSDERYLTPAVDIYENEKGLTLVADVPGSSKDGIDIKVEEGLLTIKAEAKYQLREDRIYHEFDIMNYWRQFRLSDQVDAEKIEAKLEHGVLTLELPKAEKAKPRKIDVKLG